MSNYSDEEIRNEIIYAEVGLDWKKYKKYFDTDEEKSKNTIDNSGHIYGIRLE